MACQCYDWRKYWAKSLDSFFARCFILGIRVSEKLQSRFCTAPDGLNLHALVYGESEHATPVVCLPLGPFGYRMEP